MKTPEGFDVPEKWAEIWKESLRVRETDYDSRIECELIEDLSRSEARVKALQEVLGAVSKDGRIRTHEPLGVIVRAALGKETQ